ncbi:MAG: hypothetical protein JWN07_1840 [Hyphomicrobiales bacterium]|nr:hypothetical protein [Hyphomicrobiales bacterium]
MARETLQIGVVVQRCKPVGPWAQESWLPVAALPAAPDLAVWSPLDASGAGDLRYAGAADLEFLSGQTSHYRDNLVSGRPSIWVTLRPEGDAFVVRVASADPYEGESMADGLEGNVEAVPMPAAICAVVEDFVARFHVERPFVKRKRDRMGRREQGLE